MIFDCDSYMARYERLSQWHLAFAWLPHRCGDRVVWLGWYERRATTTSLDHEGMVFEWRVPEGH